MMRYVFFTVKPDGPCVLTGRGENFDSAVDALTDAVESLQPLLGGQVQTTVHQGIPPNDDAWLVTADFAVIVMSEARIIELLYAEGGFGSLAEVYARHCARERLP